MKFKNRLEKYRYLHPDRIVKQSRKWYKKNRTSALKKCAIYYQKHKVSKRALLARADYLRFKAWDGFIPKKTECEICGKFIYFRTKDPCKAIHFDHKNGHSTPIKYIRPTQWLRAHVRTSERELLWNRCNFGKLCKRCNGWLPTENRSEFLKRAVKYAFGEDYAIIKRKRNKDKAK